MKPPNPTVHYIVSRSRHGWAVNVDADLMSEHASREEARRMARLLMATALAEGSEARFVDLSEDEDVA